MKMLAYIIGGIIIGYIAGSLFGGILAEKEAGWFAFFVVDGYKEHYGKIGALIGGILGAFSASEKNGSEKE